MGVTIYYKGELKLASSLQKMINEVEDAAKVNHWKYFIFDDAFPNDEFAKIIDEKRLFGISVTPENSESLCFTFLSNGKMCGILNFKILQMYSDTEDSNLYQVATKTQFAGFETHKKIILLLDYIQSKYFSNFECFDETNYWETKNELFLKDTFEKNTNLINSFSSGIEMIPKNENESLEDYLLRIAKIITKKNNNE